MARLAKVELLLHSVATEQAFQSIFLSTSGDLTTFLALAGLCKLSLARCTLGLLIAVDTPASPITLRALRITFVGDTPSSHELRPSPPSPPPSLHTRLTGVLKKGWGLQLDGLVMLSSSVTGFSFLARRGDRTIFSGSSKGIARVVNRVVRPRLALVSTVFVSLHFSSCWGARLARLARGLRVGKSRRVCICGILKFLI